MEAKEKVRNEKANLSRNKVTVPPTGVTGYKDKQTFIKKWSNIHMESMDNNQQKSSKSVKDMTQDEFNEEWERLFPLQASETPNWLREQAD